MFSIRPANELTLDERRSALSLALSAVNDIEQRVEFAEKAIARGELDPSAIFTCWTDGELAGVAICEVMPGRAGNLWPIRTNSNENRSAVEDALMGAAIDLFERRGARFAQTLLPRGESENDVALNRNGFRRITNVCNMLCASLPELRPIDNSLMLTNRAETSVESIPKLLNETFRDSLDCPELNAMRQVDEVYEGYLAGTPNPARWWLASVDDQPVGLLIVGDSFLPSFRDLAYLGVVPAMRRRGFGRVMLTFAMNLARTDGANGMTLLVDERNLPAIALYEEYGFRQFDIRGVYLRAIS